MADVVRLLQEMVAIPSVNPHGHPGTDQTGEQAMAEYVAGFLRGIGAEVRLEEVEPGRPNLIAVFEPPPARTWPSRRTWTRSASRG
jgi:acetylornithine deacetylase/succinyl-diaminopimelate desuccinylase-like protein